MYRLKEFEKELREDEKSRATIDKYLRDVKAFLLWLGDRELSKEMTITYKQEIITTYAARSVNSMIAGINSYLKFIGRAECCVKPLRIQRALFIDENHELTRAEFKRLMEAAGDSQIAYIMQALCGTGVRVSELKYITAEAVQKGCVTVRSKGKTRTIFIHETLQEALRIYMKKTGITSGSIFVTKNKKPLDRSVIWRKMKELCKKAEVNPEKVHPHALRHLFARIFYEAEKDLLRLADVLGHASINTTRIYTMETGRQHAESMNRVGLAIAKILAT